MATLMERLAFLQKVPTLMKATADDETPCPGYLFEEIGKISHESVGCCQCLLEYLLERLQVESCHVKLKVLKILLHVSGHGPPHFLTELRRNVTFIQEVTVYSGPPDPIHGNAPYQRVRSAAQDLASLLFTDTVTAETGLSPCKAATPTMGMGSESSPRSGLQGFGYSPAKKGTGAATLLDKIQKAAEVVASAVLPPSEQPGIRLQDNHYRAVVAPSGVVEVAVPACAYNVPKHSRKAAGRCPGQPGGGWEEQDSGHGSPCDSSRENGPIGRTSGGGSSKSGGTDSHSGASRESGDLSERVEAMQLGDCGQEVALISTLMEGSRVFLTREETQHFIKECSTLNCEVVVELLARKLLDPSHNVQMRALCAVACLMSSDLLSLDQIFMATQVSLSRLSQGASGPVTNKATKLLRQFEALMGGPRGAAHQNLPSNNPLVSDPASDSSLTEPMLPDPLAVADPPGAAGEQPPPAGSDGPSTRAGPEEERGCDSGEETADAAEGEEARETEDLSSCRYAKTQEGNLKPPEQSQTPALPSSSSHHPTLSLFSGMELVNRGKPVCLVEPVLVEPEGQTDAQMPTAPEKSVEMASVLPSSPRDSRPPSAFSFLNL
ncbi:AP-4 complex accessory subunit Tepsin [Chanos chanos]|uniref:AP-4 complex accessory subunit Tepsin n=1 Tax=Chanos chanos TaxID=29144 RepID=A0A6J2VGN5_CHACN|nr:AP-4 complex accessory subunit tepsin [Chanos chanos]